MGPHRQVQFDSTLVFFPHCVHFLCIPEISLPIHLPTHKSLSKVLFSREILKCNNFIQRYHIIHYSSSQAFWFQENFFSLFLFLWPHYATYGVLVLQPKTEPELPELGTQNLNHWPGKFLSFLNFLLKYSWFIILCQFHVYSKIIQLHIFFFRFFSIIGLNEASCAI